MISSKIFCSCGAERLELAVAVVDDADGGGEAEFDGAMGDGERVLGMVDAAAEHGIDIDVKFGVLGKELELLVEHFEAFLRDFVGLGVVDADLQVFKAGAIEALDAVGHQQIAVGDHAGDDAVAGGCGR